MIRRIYFALLQIFLLFRLVDAQYFVTTVAGNGVADSYGDGGPATSAAINIPAGLWGDTVGTLYIGEYGANKVRKVATNGIITTIAGTGSADSSGIEGYATSVALDGSWGVYGDTSGTLYIGGSLYFLWKLDLSGRIISRIAGAAPGSFGDYGDGSPATSAKMRSPRNIYLSTNGQLFFADTENHRVRVVDLLTGIISTVAGTGSAGFSGDGGSAAFASLSSPHGVWGNNAGVFFIADAGNNRIRQISATGAISTFAGGNSIYRDNVSPLNTSLAAPRDIKGDSLGNMYILAGDECRLRVVFISTNIITTIAGTGACATTSTTVAQLATSFALTVGSSLWVDSVGSIFYAEFQAKYVRKISMVTPTCQPTSQPSSQPSRQPTNQPSSQPSSQPISRPTTHPTSFPSFQPTSQPSRQPSIRPSSRPTTQPTTQPSSQPSSRPSLHPSSPPTMQPTAQPSGVPSNQPTTQPVAYPSSQPSHVPSLKPSTTPTSEPSLKPSQCPSSLPSSHPSTQLIVNPSTHPSSQPTSQPTSSPSNQPSTEPSTISSALTTQPLSILSSVPSSFPSSLPSSRSSAWPFTQPSSSPSKTPSSKPTEQPSTQPSSDLTNTPTGSSSCSSSPSMRKSTSFPYLNGPSLSPTIKPTNHPTPLPSSLQTNFHSSKPSSIPSILPTSFPSTHPSTQLFPQPSIQPTCQPTVQPTSQPNSHPTHRPSVRPSSQPSSRPTGQPVVFPTSQPSFQPTSTPSSKYTRSPTIFKPTFVPSISPTVFLTTITLNSSTWKEVLSFIGVFSSSSTSTQSTLMPLDPSEVSEGSSHIIFGGTNLFEGEKLINLSSTNPSSAVAKISPSYRRDTVSRSAMIMGDVNGDGRNDAMICNPLLASCYLFFGNTNGGLRNIAVGVTIGTSSISFSSDYFGFAMASLGDMNGDGTADVMVSALTGRVCYVMYGRSTSAWSTSRRWKVNDLVTSSTLSMGGYQIKGDMSSISVVGISLAGLDDMNGDDVRDVAVSALVSSRYVVFVIYGSVSGVNDVLLSEIMVGSRKRGFMVYGEVGYYTGFSINSGRDMNGDGMTELIVGAYSFPSSSSGKSSQVAYIIAGSKNRTSNVFLGSDSISSYGVKVVGGGGFIVSSISDVNKDGYDDVMVTSCVDYVGKSNAYIISYPSDMTSAPSFLPSSTPSLQPYSSPTSQPSTSPPTYRTTPTLTDDPTSFATPQPTNINSTQSPVVVPTRRPTRIPTRRATSPPRTLNPSRCPTIRPSTSFMPTRLPTISITRIRATSSPTKPIPFPTIHPTSSHSPSSLPTTTTKNNGAYSVRVVNSSSPKIVYGQEGANEYFYISSLSANGVERGGVSVTIYGRGGKKVYMFTPKDPMPPRNKIVIGDFDEREDKLDLSLISGLHGVKDLAYVTHPLTFKTPDEQLIVLSSHMRNDLGEENFVFSASDSSSLSRSSYFVNMMSSASFLIPLVLLAVSVLVVIGVSVVQKEEKDGMYKISKEEESSVFIERGDSDRRKNTENQEQLNFFSSSSLLNNISNDREDRDTIVEEFGGSNIVSEGVAPVKSVNSGGSVSLSSDELEDMFSVPSSFQSHRSDINSDEEESSSESDEHSLVYELIEIGENQTSFMKKFIQPNT